MVVKARLIRIGNSRVIRVPNRLLEQANLPDEVELLAEPGRLLVTAARPPRAGWAEAPQRMRQREDDRLLFDKQEWEWR